jgi:hypothetical protein
VPSDLPASLQRAPASSPRPYFRVIVPGLE